MPDFVVRGGMATPDGLQDGYEPHDQVPGLFGFSVQYDSQVSLDELCRAGQFPNSMVSYATTPMLQAALAGLGYRMQLVKSPGKGYHHTFAVLYDASGIMLRDLPETAALAISNTFTRMANPHRVRQNRRKP